jgi:heavy metal sensor kinase
MVLVAFGFYFLSVISTIGLERIDREVYALGESQLHVWHSKKHWEDFDRSLSSIYGPDEWHELIVHVTDADHQTLYRSPHWPSQITTASFPDFDTKMEKGPGPGRNDDRPPNPRSEPPRHRRPNDPPEPVGGPRDHVNSPDERDGRPLAPSQSMDNVKIKRQSFRTFSTPDGDWRVGIMGNQHITILIGMNLAGFHEDAGRFRNSFLLAIPLSLVLLAAGGWLIAHRALKPVAKISGTAERITVRGLGTRVPQEGADSEFLHLIQIINSMLERLEKSFNQAIRFSADAAHELQTPLTILQGALDEAVQSCSSGTDEQRRYASLLEEVQRLKTIVQKLLILARADANQMLSRREPVDLSGLVLAAVEDSSILNPNLSIEGDVAPGVRVQGDTDLLRLAIQELVKNAVKYNRDGGQVRAALRSSGNLAKLFISNSGPAIPPEERNLVFERFYRVDKSRSRKVPGTGLGLSLAREIARAHGGELRLDSSSTLTTFVLSLPAPG